MSISTHSLSMGLGLLVLASAAQAEDLGFRYNKDKRLCLNDKGVIGYNPDFEGDCGLLKGKDLKWRNLTFPWDAMPGAQFDGANLYGASITGIPLSEPADGYPDYGISFPTASLQNASLKNVDLRLADFDAVDLSEANFEGATFGHSFLERSNLSRAKLAGLDLSDTNVRMSDFSGADLTGTSFRGNMGMHQTKFDGATLERANLQGAYLYGASLREAFLSGADFSHSQLIGADLTDAEVNGTLFVDASYNEDTLLPFSEAETKKRGMRLVSEAPGNKTISIQGNADGSCSPTEVHLMKGEKVTFSLKGDPSKMFLLSIPDFQIELMTMGADPVKKPYTPNQNGTFKFTCGPHGASDDQLTHGTIMVM